MRRCADLSVQNENPSEDGVVDDLVPIFATWCWRCYRSCSLLIKNTKNNISSIIHPVTFMVGMMIESSTSIFKHSAALKGLNVEKKVHRQLRYTSSNHSIHRPLEIVRHS